MDADGLRNDSDIDSCWSDYDINDLEALALEARTRADELLRELALRRGELQRQLEESEDM